MPVLKKRLITSVLALTFLTVIVGCQGKVKEKNEAAAPSAAPAEVTEVTDALVQAISAKFAAARPDLVVKDVATTNIPNIYQVTFDGKGIVYVVGEADYFFVGDLLQIQQNQIVNIREEAMNAPRAKMLASVNDDDMIVFSPAGEVKASVVVFTDVDCGYCRKLHDEVPKMNDLGIQVKYMAYPRAGIESESYRRIASAWCASDPQAAITELKSGNNIPIAVCDTNPVADHFRMGIEAGLSGTPAIVLESGRLIPGYMTAESLAQTLGI